MAAVLVAASGTASAQECLQRLYKLHPKEEIFAKNPMGRYPTPGRVRLLQFTVATASVSAALGGREGGASNHGHYSYELRKLADGALVWFIKYPAYAVKPGGFTCQVVLPFMKAKPRTRSGPVGHLIKLFNSLGRTLSFPVSAVVVNGIIG
jgi:hypothetical protein